MERSDRTDADVNRVLAAWQTRGRSICEFAWQCGLKRKRFYRWKRRFREVVDGAPALRPVHVVEATAVEPIPVVPTRPGAPAPSRRPTRRRWSSTTRSPTSSGAATRAATTSSSFGKGKATTVWEFLLARFIRYEHVQEVLRCRCNGCLITAPGAPRLVPGGRHGASFLAHFAVAKCADHMPIYRLEMSFACQGIPVSRSTRNEHVHRAAAILEPLWGRLRAVILIRPVVVADETRLRTMRDLQCPTRNGFVWNFGACDDAGGLDVAYVLAEDRSGSMPKSLLRHEPA